MSSKTLALFWLRIFLGVNYLFHGVPRLAAGLPTFATKTAAGFEGTLLPPALALPFGYAIPIAELVLGLLLLSGIRKREVLQAAFGLMVLLAAGICLQQNWAVAGTQVPYALALFFLLYFDEKQSAAANQTQLPKTDSA